MRLPNANLAFVDIRKLRDYCLNDRHPRGRHKARLFNAVLGFTSDDAELLQELILAAARHSDHVVRLPADEYGQRFQLDFLVNDASDSAMVRTAWMIRQNEDFPRLTTCYVM